MASRFLLRGGALSARGHRLLAGQMGTPPSASVALAGQGLRHHSASSRAHISSVRELVEAMMAMERRLDALEANNSNKETPATKSSSRQWTPPEAGWVKINVDACFAAEFGEATVGVVIHDERGEKVAASTKLPNVREGLPACSSKEEARMAACKSGLQLALEYAGTGCAILDVDALTRTCREDPSRLPVINQEIMRLKEEFEELRIAKIKRCQNTVAHQLALLLATSRS